MYALAIKYANGEDFRIKPDKKSGIRPKRIPSTADLLMEISARNSDRLG
jgi:hypothetical protein